MFKKDVNEIADMFTKEIIDDIKKAVSSENPSQMARVMDALVDEGETDIIAKREGLEFLRLQAIHLMDLPQITEILEKSQDTAEKEWKKMEDKVCG